MVRAVQNSTFWKNMARKCQGQWGFLKTYPYWYSLRRRLDFTYLVSVDRTSQYFFFVWNVSESWGWTFNVGFKVSWSMYVLFVCPNSLGQNSSFKAQLWDHCLLILCSTSAHPQHDLVFFFFVCLLQRWEIWYISSCGVILEPTMSLLCLNV